jgi:hypothetical protein
MMSVFARDSKRTTDATHTNERRKSGEGHEVHPEVLPPTGAESNDNEPADGSDRPGDGEKDDLELIETERLNNDRSEGGQTT